MTTTYRKIFTGIIAMIIAFSPLVFSSKTASAATCKVTAAEFSKTTLDYKESTRTKNLIGIGISTTDCVGKQIYVTLAGGAISTTGVGVEALNKRSFVVPSSGSFGISMVPGVDSCTKASVGKNCEYRIFAGPETKELEYNSSGRTKGDLKYDCDAILFCEGGSLWNKLNDTSDNEDKVGECVVMNAFFDKTTLTFKDANPPDVTMSVTTRGCAGRNIYLSLISKGIGSDGHLVPEIHDQELLVPVTEKVSLTMKSGEKGCYNSLVQETVDGSTGCKYALFAGIEKSIDRAKLFFPPPSVRNYFWSDGQPNGNLEYLCDEDCLSDWHKSGANTALIGNAFGEISAECLDKDGNRIEDCYALYSGLGDVLGTVGDGLTSKLSTVASATGLGDLFNRIIAFGIGIAGVLAVAMIVYEGVAYMRAKGDGNTSNLAQAKSRIGEVLLGFLLVLSIYVILRTINPDLLNLTPRVDNVELLSPEVYKEITGKNLPTTGEINSSAIRAVSGTEIDSCAIKALMEKESQGKAQAIGHDENVTVENVPSRKAFVLGGQKFNGETFTSNINLYFNKFLNSDKAIAPTDKNLGLDWRYSHGIGTMQVTFFPANWKAGYTPPYSQRNTPPETRKCDGKEYYPADMLDYEKNAIVGTCILKDFLKKCNNDLGKAFGAYNSNNCTTSTPYARDVIARYNKCVKE